MTLLPVTMKPGVFRNGTQYQAKGRWFECDLIRWHDGALRPIGGWEVRVDNAGAPQAPLTVTPQTTTFRDGITYRSNVGGDYALFGSNASLVAVKPDGTHLLVTPAGFVAGNNDVTYLIGYGYGTYGSGTYGTPRNVTNATPVPVLRWSFSMWGEEAICATVNSGPIYQYTPLAAAATVIPNAPTDVADVLVTSDRILMTIKNGPTEIREVLWSDREDYNNWTFNDITNYAGTFKLQGTGDLIGLYQVQEDILILSETDAHVGRFLGAPLVYGFEKIGEHCEPIVGSAVIKTERFAMWMGHREFWMYDGTLKQVPCDIMDHIIETIDLINLSKLHVTTIGSFRELWWFYQSKNSTTDEVDSYVIFDYADGSWAYGSLDRTCAIDHGAYVSPIMVDADGYIWNHEQQSIKVDGVAFAGTGPMELGEGDELFAVRYAFLDTEMPDAIELEFATRGLPTQAETLHGPFPFATPVPTTGVMGREVRMIVKGLTNDWEVGNIRLDVDEVGGGFR